MIQFAESFSNIFTACGQCLCDNIVGLLPSVMVLLMLFNAVCHWIGQEKIEKFSAVCAKNYILSYTVLPFISWFFLCNPACYTAGKFLKQRQRASLIDILATTNGPMLSIFPHVNPGELFIWLGIASGVEQLGYSVVPLAIRFFIAGWVLAFIRAFITEKLWVFFAKREGIDTDR